MNKKTIPREEREAVPNLGHMAALRREQLLNLPESKPDEPAATSAKQVTILGMTATPREHAIAALTGLAIITTIALVGGCWTHAHP
jgi:hypothetical protein